MDDIYYEAIVAVAKVIIFVAFMAVDSAYGTKRQEKVIVLVFVLDDDIRATIMQNEGLDVKMDVENNGLRHVVTLFVHDIIVEDNEKVVLSKVVDKSQRHFSNDFKGHLL